MQKKSPITAAFLRRHDPRPPRVAKGYSHKGRFGAGLCVREQVSATCAFRRHAGCTPAGDRLTCRCIS